MPLHDVQCRLCGEVEERFIPLADLGKELTHRCPRGRAGELGIQDIVHLKAPMVAGDIPDYESPVTGQIIRGRAARREDLLRHGCHEYDPSEKDHAERNRRQQDEAFDQGIEETLEREISSMPARKRELLEQEARAVDLEVKRTAPKL